VAAARAIRAPGPLLADDESAGRVGRLASRLALRLRTYRRRTPWVHSVPVFFGTGRCGFSERAPGGGLLLALLRERDPVVQEELNALRARGGSPLRKPPAGLDADRFGDSWCSSTVGSSDLPHRVNASLWGLGEAAARDTAFGRGPAIVLVGQVGVFFGYREEARQPAARELPGDRTSQHPGLLAVNGVRDLRSSTPG